MPCKLFDQISGKIHRDKDLYDLISDTMVFETGRRHLCNRSLYYREKFLFRNKTGARKNLSLSLSLRSRKIEKSGACIGECVPRACVRSPPLLSLLVLLVRWQDIYRGHVYLPPPIRRLHQPLQIALSAPGYFQACQCQRINRISAEWYVASGSSSRADRYNNRRPSNSAPFFLSFCFFLLSQFLLFLESSRHGGLKINPIVEKKFPPRDAFPFEIGRKVKAASIEASIRAKEFRGG